MKNILKLFLLVVMLGCEDKTTDVDEIFTFSGYVYYKMSPALNVVICADNDSAYITVSDVDGFFKMENLPPGEHSVNLFLDLSDNSFSTRTLSLTVTEDIFVDDLVLPKGVQVLFPEEIGSTSLVLKWTATDAEDFREYKIFQHISSGLDEVTGTLVHVSTSIDDTVFQVDNLDPYETYYFRVYVMNEFGKLGGSNIVSAITLNQNAIENGSFEIINPQSNFAESWRIGSVLSDTYVEIDQSVSFEGNNSLHFYGLEEQYAFSSIAQDIDPDKIIPGKNYELSFWVKYDTLAAYHTGWIDLYPISTHFIHIDGPQKSTSWMQVSKSFVVPDDVNDSLHGFAFHFAQIVNQVIPDIPLSIWIDAIELKRI